MKRILLLAIAITTLVSVSAQEHILHLLPKLRTALGEDMEEGYDAMACADKHPTTSFVFENIAKERLPQGLADSLMIAFERELPLAQESDRYQVSKNGHKTLSYTLAIKGKLSQESGRVISFMNHSVASDVETAAMLDVKDDSLLTFRYLQQTDQSIKADYDTKPFDELISRIAQMEGVKNRQVEFILTDKKKRPRYCFFTYRGGIGRRTGIRYEVPKEQAQQIMAEFKQVARSYFNSEQPIYVSGSRNTCHAAFAWKEVRMAEIVDDGRLFLLSAKVVEGNMQIPRQWTKITYYNDGIER